MNQIVSYRIGECSYVKSMKEDKKLLLEYKRNCIRIFGSKPWNIAIYVQGKVDIPQRVLNQEFKCDGTFVRQENCNKKISYREKNKGPFHVDEFLILYLSGVKRLNEMQQQPDLNVVVEFLELNRRSFRRNKNYKLHYEPIFQEIRDMAKVKGTKDIIRRKP